MAKFDIKLYLVTSLVVGAIYWFLQQTEMGRDTVMVWITSLVDMIPVLGVDPASTLYMLTHAIVLAAIAVGIGFIASNSMK